MRDCTHVPNNLEARKMKGIVCYRVIDYRDVCLAVRTAAQHGVDMSEYLLKGTRTESWTSAEAKAISLWIGRASMTHNERLWTLA